ncbi:MAG: flagellar basal body-associated FliL family protein [Bdellovibrionia bacterium]
MSDHGEAPKEHSPEGEKKERDSGGSFKALLVPLINSIALLGALGFLTYTKLIYKHPAITDAAETTRIVETNKKEALNEQVAIPTIPFELITVNIQGASNTPQGIGSDGKPARMIGAKHHYLTLEFHLEIQKPEHAALIESLRPFLLDQLIQVAAKKTFEELATVQGRYLFQSQLVDIANQTLAKRMNPPPRELIVTHLYFTTFLVQ